MRCVHATRRGGVWRVRVWSVRFVAVAGERVLGGVLFFSRGGGGTQSGFYLAAKMYLSVWGQAEEVVLHAGYARGFPILGHAPIVGHDELGVAKTQGQHRKQLCHSHTQYATAIHSDEGCLLRLLTRYPGHKKIALFVTLV